MTGLKAILATTGLAIGLALVSPGASRADALDDAIAWFNEIGLKQGGQPVDRDNVEKLQSPSISQNARREITDDKLVHFLVLPKLYSLDLSQCKVTDAGMATVAKSATLANLRLFSTAVGDAGVAALATAPELQNLDLDKTPITDAALKSLAGYPKLRQLTINSTAVTAEGIGALKDLKSLRNLTAASLGAFSPDMLPAMAAIEGLTDLSLVGNDLDAAMEGLAGSKVQRLNVTGAKLGDAGGVALGGLTELALLSANQTAIGDGTIAALAAGASKLDTLHASSTAVTDDAGPSLAALSGLKTLWLDRTAVTDALMPNLVGLPLQTLNLDGVALTDAGLKALEAVKTLKSLAIPRTQVTDAGVAALEAAIPGIRIRR